MFYFRNREAARTFARTNEHYTVSDQKDNPSKGRGYRWAVKVLA